MNTLQETIAEYWPYLAGALAALILIIPATRERLVSTFILWTSRHYAVIGHNKEKRRERNNFTGVHIFIVPLSPQSIDIFIKRLRRVRQDLVHASKHHSGVSVRNIGKGGRK